VECIRNPPTIETLSLNSTFAFYAKAFCYGLFCGIFVPTVGRCAFYLDRLQNLVIVTQDIFKREFAFLDRLVLTVGVRGQRGPIHFELLELPGEY
jgi:hypothetical protein